MIIGISGKRGVGKTTAADYLVKEYHFEKVSFAEDLKSIAKTLIPFTEIDLSSIKRKEAKFKNYDWSPRDFLIHLGEFMRFHDTDYWLNRALSKCKDPLKGYVFDDVRYQNEADAIKRLGGKILRISRYEHKNPYGKNIDTPSETNMDSYTYDFHIQEMWNTSITELHRQLRNFIETINDPK